MRTVAFTSNCRIAGLLVLLASILPLFITNQDIKILMSNFHKTESYTCLLIKNTCATGSKYILSISKVKSSSEAKDGLPQTSNSNRSPHPQCTATIVPNYYSQLAESLLDQQDQCQTLTISYKRVMGNEHLI